MPQMSIFLHDSNSLQPYCRPKLVLKYVNGVIVNCYAFKSAYRHRIFVDMQGICPKPFKNIYI